MRIAYQDYSVSENSSSIDAAQDLNVGEGLGRPGLGHGVPQSIVLFWNNKNNNTEIYRQNNKDYSSKTFCFIVMLLKP